MSRCKRYCFTLNNYTVDFDYAAKLRSHVRCVRFVFGREVGANGTRHLQGFIEFSAQVRFVELADFLPAHWESTRGSAMQNFQYCTKEKDFTTHGNWEPEIKALRNKLLSGKKFSYYDLVCDLLSDQNSNAILRSEYIRNRQSVDHVVSVILELRIRHARFDELVSSFVCSWQSECLVHTSQQPRRKICWYVDPFGGLGKTWLAHLLRYVYSYDCFDGVTSARDLCQMISMYPVGFVIDVTRQNSTHFSYNTLEMLKNGYVMSGKYAGIKKLFKPVPVIVFSNFEPETTGTLSADRWCLHHLDHGPQKAIHPLPPTPKRPPPLPTQEEEEPQEDAGGIVQDGPG